MSITSQVELSPLKMAEKALQFGQARISRSLISTFCLAITAGVFIGIAFIFYIVVTTGAQTLPYGMVKLIGGLVFSIGLILVAVCGGELFTSSILSIVAKANNSINMRQMLTNWTVVYLGNFVGALILVSLMLTAKHYFQANGEVGLNYLYVAKAKLQYDFMQAVALGIMCNLLVCLAVWMTYSAQSATDKVLVIILPVSMFVASGFEHCIANMFLIPLAIVIKNNAPVEFWQATGANANDFYQLTWSNFFTNNLLPVTIGNIIGGAILVGLTYWFIHLKNNDTCH
ncbi:formate transporter FocA [Thalassotalea sp. PLHSN55]|uniref:formate transporter FocA n=1 Tax=Thalassotalea sp. PLHSN55 TaxID=3435888 RepID=UPI003F826666